MEQAMARSEDTTQLDAVLTEPEDRQTLAESITGRLRQLILDGQLPPSQALRPADLAPRLGVSVMPVREALRILEAEGLVTFRPRIGARVAEIKEEDVEELYVVRVALEGLAARLGAANLTDAGLAELHAAFDQMTAARARDDFDTFSQYDREFHRRQYAASGRTGLVKRILDLWDVGRRIYAISPRTRESMDPAYEAHRSILDALDRHDVDAAEQRTRIHTEEAAQRILKALGALNLQDDDTDLQDGHGPV
jgi:DNA-binding GntR family transcriptional regulator